MGREKLSLFGLFSPGEEDLSVRANREHSPVKHVHVFACEASGNAEAHPLDRALSFRLGRAFRRKRRTKASRQKKGGRLMLARRWTISVMCLCGGQNGVFQEKSGVFQEIGLHVLP